MIRKSRVLPLVLLVLLSAACLEAGVNKAASPQVPKASEITSEEFMKDYGGGDYVLIDVRSDEEHASGYIPGALHIPYTEIGERIDELNLTKDQKIVVYCEAGVRSHKASDTLLEKGYTNVVDITDGIRGWKALGGELAYPGEEKTLPELSGAAAPLISAEKLMESSSSYKAIYLGTKSGYEAGHIPGSLYINPLEDLFDPEGSYPHLVLQKDDFEALMSRLGLTGDDHVVVYDDEPDHKYAARMLWILRYYGHGKAAILDGGLKAWENAGGELSADTRALPEPTSYKAKSPDQSLIATLEQVEAAVDDPDTVIIDATTSEEYLNEGHIPGAIFIAPEHTLNPDGTIMDRGELRDLYESHGVTEDKEVITYCHTGHRASVLWYELKELLGYPRVRLYDGSLEEWKGEGMPIETGIPETTSPPSTALPTTVPPSTTPPASTQTYLEVEPSIVLKDFTGTQTSTIKIGDVIQIDDAYIYLTADWDGCLGTMKWIFKIYRDTPSGRVWESNAIFGDYEVHTGQDISNRIHRGSDALDDYQIIVDRWGARGEGLALEITKTVS